METCFETALKLHDYLMKKHWNGFALRGPDPGIRFNYRVGRFIQSYFPFLRKGDDYAYIQGQGYWILSNWLLFSMTGKEAYRQTALACSGYLVESQRDDGGWDYPNREWKGRVANAEGTWGAIGLLESYRRGNCVRSLESVLKWYTFLVEKIGFRKGEDPVLAANYFAGVGTSSVPNNTAFTLRFLAELRDATGDSAYLSRCPGLLAFLRKVQKPSGELPYSIELESGKETPHFQCYQYNAFQCLDLMKYYELTGDGRAGELIMGLLNFLRTGLAPDGHAYYRCGNGLRMVFYHTAVVGAAFLKALSFSPEYESLSSSAYRYLLEHNRADGSFSHSEGDYLLLQDRISYPRYQAMILYFLLLKTSSNPDATGSGRVQGCAVPQ